MKQSTFLKAGFLAAVAVTVASLAVFTPAQAATRNGAIVTRTPGGCTIFLAPFGLIIADVQDVQTPSGNENFTCHGQVPAGTEPDRPVLIKDAPCVGFSGLGSGDLRVTPSGNVIVNCHIRP